MACKMAKSSVSTATSILASHSCRETRVAETLPAEYAHEVNSFFIRKGSSEQLAENQNSKDFYSHLFRHFLKANYVHRGRVSCSFAISPAFINIYNGLHGGVIGGIAERIAIGCARTVVADDKPLFLGELSMSYLSVAQLDEECVVNGSIVRSGRNLTVVAVEFRIKTTDKLVYAARASFYHVPVAKL